ncbi:hypothetical protein VTL71DRAFT_1217 [Oculimacula yallundae]|uniref:Uncharacterized protein n=1 Tax=Oculimacula yallundae TaxID=86028 RepID=A0ABR4CA28_9HELO
MFKWCKKLFEKLGRFRNRNSQPNNAGNAVNPQNNNQVPPWDVIYTASMLSSRSEDEISVVDLENPESISREITRLDMERETLARHRTDDWAVQEIRRKIRKATQGRDSATPGVKLEVATARYQEAVEKRGAKILGVRKLEEKISGLKERRKELRMAEREQMERRDNWD